MHHQSKYSSALHISFVFILLILGCHSKSCPIQEENERLREELKTCQNENTQVRYSSDSSLIHTVYFDLKSDLNPEQKQFFVNELKKLSKIKTIKEISIGAYEDLQDARALQEYDFSMVLRFNHLSEYQQYQTDSIHLQSKMNTKDLLAAPPRTYDFFFL